MPDTGPLVRLEAKFIHHLLVGLTNAAASLDVPVVEQLVAVNRTFTGEEIDLATGLAAVAQLAREWETQGQGYAEPAEGVRDAVGDALKSLASATEQMDVSASGTGDGQDQFVSNVLRCRDLITMLGVLRRAVSRHLP